MFNISVPEKSNIVRYGGQAGTVFLVELVGGPRFWGLGRSPRINRVRVSLTF